MSFTPIQATAHQKTPFDEVIERNLATLSNEEIQELRSDQHGEITEALQLLCKTDSIHLRQSKIRRWNHKLSKYLEWLPAILDVLSDPITMSFPGSHIASGMLKAIAKIELLCTGLGHLSSYYTNVTTSDEELIWKLLLCVYEDLLKFYRIARELFRKEGGKFRSYEDKFSTIVGDFSDHVRNLDSAAISQIWKNVRVWDKNLSAIHTTMKSGFDVTRDRLLQIQQGQQRMEIRLNQQDVDRCLDLFGTGLNNDDVSDLLDEIAGETYGWVFSDPRSPLVDWIVEKSSQNSAKAFQNILAVTGEKGCGKTTLTAYAASHIVRNLQTGYAKEPLVCRFFGGMHDIRRNIGCEILRGLLYEAFAADNSLIRHAAQYLSAQGGRTLVTSELQLLQILTAVISADPRRQIFLFIDDYDRYSVKSRKNLTKKILELATKFHSLRVFLTFKRRFDLQGVETELSADENTKFVHMDMSEFVDRDITALVNAHMDDLCANGCSRHVVDRIANKIILGSSSCMLWTKILLKRLENISSTNEKTLERLVQETPPGLGHAYMQLLEGINEDDRGDAIKILRILVGARRPLSLLELQHASAIGEAQHNMSQLLEDMERNAATIHGSQDDQQAQETHYGRYLHRLLGCLVKIRGSKIVEPIHQSLCSFLACLNEESQSGGEFASTTSRELRQAFHCPRKLCNLSFSVICIRYLSLDDFRTVDLWRPLQNSNQFGDFEWLALNLAGLDDLSLSPLHADLDKEETADAQYPFFAYAAQYWPDHFACCHEEADSSLLEAAITLSTPASALMKNWTSQYSAGIAADPALWYLRVSWSDLPQIDPLIISSYFGHTSVLRHIASKALRGSPGSKVGSESDSAEDRFLGDQDQAGLIAVRMGHLDCFRELEKIDKSIQSRNGSESKFETRQYLSTALHASAECGQVKVVQYLLQKNVDLEFMMNGCTPLGAAVDALHVDVVEKLLAPSQVSLQPCGPIFIAARQKWEHFSPENAHAHRAILDLLAADSRIEWGQRDNNGRTFLSYAAESGFVELFDIFARFRETNIMSRWLNDGGDNAGRTPVWFAAGWGHVEFLKRLNGVGDISRQMYALGPERENAFVKAARSGFVEVMRFLVSQDEDCRGIDEPDESGRTPLSVAAWSTDQAATEMAAILLATGRVDVDSKSDSGQTPLSYAIGSGNTSMVRLLVESGADMRAVVRRGDDGLLTLIRYSPALPEQKVAMMAEIEHLWVSHMGKVGDNQEVT